jgi:hypothetical protein
MNRKTSLLSVSLAALLLSSPLLPADWNFNAGDSPNAFIQTDRATVELNCRGIRFAPAAWEDSQDIERKQGLSIRFLENGSIESGAFQAGSENATIHIVDNYPVEIVFNDPADYNFVLDQASANAALNLSMVDQDVSYGIFSLDGSGAAIDQLRRACGPMTTHSGGRQEEPAGRSYEAPEGLVFCGGGGIKRVIEYVILDDAPDQWDARVTVNGETVRAMTAYSYFGNQPEPEGFIVALLGEDRSEFLVFDRNSEVWVEFGDYAYRPCN